jgi:hypothetical protein
MFGYTNPLLDWSGLSWNKSYTSQNLSQSISIQVNPHGIGLTEQGLNLLNILHAVLFMPCFVICRCHIPPFFLCSLISIPTHQAQNCGALHSGIELMFFFSL